jgi:Protein of unknown function (DUF2510).
MDELTARLRERVDAQKGGWRGRLSVVLNELGYADITSAIGDEINERLAAGNMTISPDISNPGFVAGAWVKVEATAPAPGETTPWEPAASSDGDPPAGWYDDPDAPGQQRYWEGHQWAGGVHSGQHGTGGSVPFAYELKLDFPPSEFASRILGMLSGSLANLGYAPTIQIEGSASYVRRYSPWYFILLYIIFFPIGLLLLLARPIQTVAISWREEGGGGTFAEIRGVDARVRGLIGAMADATRTL